MELGNQDESVNVVTVESNAIINEQKPEQWSKEDISRFLSAIEEESAITLELKPFNVQHEGKYFSRFLKLLAEENGKEIVEVESNSMSNELELELESKKKEGELMNGTGRFGKYLFPLSIDIF